MADYTSSETTPPPDETQTSTAEKQEHSEPETLPRDITGWKWAVTSIAILSSIFLYSLDGTIVAVIQATIVTEFDSLNDLAWINVGFLMAGTATNMVWGQVYSQFNSKWMYLLNVILFEVGSAICGAAPNMNAMIIGRVICGIGGAGLYVGVLNLIAATTTMAERPLYVSGTGITWGLGTVLGPVVGGAFEQSAVGWRWAFYINLFIGAVCAPAYIFLLPSVDPRPGVSLGERASQLDYAGMVLLIGSLVSFVMAINFGGLTYPWNSGQIIALFVVAAVLVSLLGVQQRWAVFTTLARRLIPIQLLGSRTVLMLFASTSASAAGAFIPIFFVPLFFQFTRDDGALDAGIRLLPLIIVLVVAIFVNGLLMAKFGYYMPWYIVGSLISVVGGALMYTVDRSSSQSAIYGYTVLIGFGICIFIQASFSVAQAVVDPKNVAAVIGFVTLAQYLGNTTALAIANSLFLNLAETKVQKILPEMSASEIEAAISGVAGGFVQRLDDGVKGRVIDAIVDSISKTYILVMTAGALVALLSLFMKREKLFINASVAAV
ncbi:Efflux pump DEP3 [Colletotrichum gloeosporioides]|uniref:Efflux pump DEP3 n=1 Tax=Colletotrichum gloeosporioides TaxID=474922 RepID=A0A8H4FCK3_COLGL|nr:Efflux pump DEP3 [Colletotrichum gloeosporioides]KAF3797748.1 Efflux pump DEP3 [Colletotrichum gloeosporioides]